MLEDGGLVPARLAQRFAGERIFGTGAAVSRAVLELRWGERPWYECGGAGAVGQGVARGAT